MSNILIFEKDPEYREFLIQAFGPSNEITFFSSTKEVKPLLRNTHYDVVILDVEHSKKDPLYLKTVYSYIDKKYEIKKNNEKFILESYIALKEILSEDQMEILKDLCSAQSKE